MSHVLEVHGVERERAVMWLSLEVHGDDDCAVLVLDVVHVVAIERSENDMYTDR